MRAARSHSFRRSRASRTGRVRLHRRLLQHPPPSLRPRLSRAGRLRAERRVCYVIRIASAPADVKLRFAQLLRFAPALRVTSSSAAARCAYAESRAFGLGDSATIIKPASIRFILDAQLSTRPPNRGRLRVVQTVRVQARWRGFGTPVDEHLMLPRD